VTQRLHPEIHPDADQISVFLEGAAPKHERAQMLAHLTHCAACREIVFLAQGVEAELQPAETSASPRRMRWWMPLGLAGAALACGAAVLLVYIHQSGAPAANRQIATVQPVGNQENESQVIREKQPPQSPVQSSGRPGIQPPPTPPPPKSAPVAASGSGGALGAGVLQPAPPPAVSSPSVAASEELSQAARGNSLRFPANTGPQSQANIAPPQASPGTAGAQAAQVQQQGSQGGPSAVQSYQYSRLKLAKKPTLQILHDRGTTEGMGEVSGVVTDATGAVIPCASVSLQSAPDNTTRQAAAGPDGRFTISDVPAGRYELHVTAQGFMATSEPLELKSRDVAILDSVLQLGAVTQTIAVEASNETLETTSAQASADTLSLDSKLPAAAIARVSISDRMLSADAAGNLYLSRDAGKIWKKIKPKWQGKVAHLALVPAHDEAAAESVEVTKPTPAPQQIFEIATDTGAVWTSEDGKHWHPRAGGNR
jgi:hypothetical protein